MTSFNFIDTALIKDIGLVASGITAAVIIPIIKTIFQEYRNNAPIRRAKRQERIKAKQAHQAKFERIKQLKKLNKK